MYERVSQVLNENEAPLRFHRCKRQWNPARHGTHELQEICSHSRSINQGGAHYHDFQPRGTPKFLQSLFGFQLRNTIWIEGYRYICLPQRTPVTAFANRLDATHENETARSGIARCTRNAQRSCHVRRTIGRKGIDGRIVKNMHPRRKVHNDIAA